MAGLAKTLAREAINVKRNGGGGLIKKVADSFCKGNEKRVGRVGERKCVRREREMCEMKL